MVGSRRFEITIVSAENLPDVRRLGRMKTYAAVSLNGATKSTHVDTEGESNPRWNSRFVFTVDESSLQRSELTVVVNLFCERFLGDKFIGQAKLPMKELLDMGVGSHKTLSYTVYGAANGTLNIHYWFEEKLVAPPPHREKTTHTESVQFINNVLIQSFEAPKIAARVETKAAPLKALEPPKTLPRVGTNEAALKSFQAAKTMPQVETNTVPLKSLEPPKIVHQGETNGAALKSQQAPKVLPWGETNAAPLKSAEAPKTATQAQTNGAALKSSQAPKTVQTNVPPLKAPEAPKTVTHATRALPQGGAHAAPFKAPEAQKDISRRETNGAVLKPQMSQQGKASAAPLKALEAPKAAPRGETKASVISVATGVEWRSS